MNKKHTHAWRRLLIAALVVLTVLSGTGPPPAAHAQDPDGSSPNIARAIRI
jgi:hypothetical protein